MLLLAAAVGFFAFVVVVLAVIAAVRIVVGGLGALGTAADKFGWPRVLVALVIACAVVAVGINTYAADRAAKRERFADQLLLHYGNHDMWVEVCEDVQTSGARAVRGVAEAMKRGWEDSSLAERGMGFYVDVAEDFIRAKCEERSQ